LDQVVEDLVSIWFMVEYIKHEDIDSCLIDLFKLFNPLSGNPWTFFCVKTPINW